jgi:serine protease Do
MRQKHRSIFNWISHFILGWLLVCGSHIALADELPSPPPLPSAYIDAIASRTTVVIAQDLRVGEVEVGTAFNPGSGAIVARAGNLYYVVTNLHVVQINTAYGIRTYDGKIHVVSQDDNDYGIQRLGETVANTIQGFDLAIITFESDQDYPIVGVDASADSTQGAATFVSGWPQSATHQPMSRRFSPGEIVTVQPPDPDGGYGLFYTSSTTVGMSGGPVFNAQGQVIGIHGRGQGDRIQGNQGIEVNYLIRQTDVAKHLSAVLQSLTFQSQPPDAATLARWVSVRPATASQFDDPEAAFRDAFRQDALRHCSGSWVDTGEREEACHSR